jgi:hypothetical protein
MKSVRSYKALYLQCAKESAAKDRLIAMQHEQVMQLAGENQRLRATNADQTEQIKQYRQLHAEQEVIILGQAEKLSQLQTIITGQKAANASQQKQLDKCRKEILRLDNIRYEVDES